MNLTISDIATTMLDVITLGSLLYVSRQVAVSRQQAKGQFLLALDDQFEKSNAITLRLLSQPDFTPAGDEWLEVWRLMSVFERINIMVEDRILDVALVDRLHGFRLRGIIANDAVYERVKATGSDWQDFIDLCYAVVARHEKVSMDDRDRAFAARVRTLNKTVRSSGNPFSMQNP